MPIVASLPMCFFTAATIDNTSDGNEPPLVSHSTTCVAPDMIAD